MLITTAIRNLFRHKTRMLLSLFTIAGAIASIILFRGYSSDIMESLKRYGVENQFGHIQITSKKMWAPETQRLKDRLITLSNNLMSELRALKEVKSISPRLSLEALLSYEESQFGARIVGYDPVLEPMIFDSVKIYGNGPFKSGDENEILLGVGLKKRLKVNDGDTITIITQTVDGVVNALDVVVLGAFATTVSEMDDQLAYVPLKLAKKLLNTDMYEIAVLRIQDMDQHQEAITKVRALTAKLQPDLDQKTWRDLANLYNQVEEFYSMQNLIIQIILSLLTILAVMNTVGMTVYERTGEIGTLRALGLTKVEIVRQFLGESIILGLAACITGAIFGSLAIAALNSSGIEVNLPGSSVPVALLAEYNLSAYLLAFLFGFGATVIGTLIPAYSAAQLSIIEALRRNI